MIVGTNQSETSANKYSITANLLHSQSHLFPNHPSYYSKSKQTNIQTTMNTLNIATNPETPKHQIQYQNIAEAHALTILIPIDGTRYHRRRNSPHRIHSIPPQYMVQTQQGNRQKKAPRVLGRVPRRTLVSEWRHSQKVSETTRPCLHRCCQVGENEDQWRNIDFQKGKRNRQSCMGKDIGEGFHHRQPLDPFRRHQVEYSE